MKKAISILLFVFLFNNASYATYETYVLNFKNVEADILTAKELNIVFFHIVDNVVVEKTPENFILKFQTIAKDIQSNIQFLLNDKYFTEVALIDVEKKLPFDFLKKSVNVEDELEMYQGIIEGNEIKTTKINLIF